MTFQYPCIDYPIYKMCLISTNLIIMHFSLLILDTFYNNIQLQYQTFRQYRIYIHACMPRQQTIVIASLLAKLFN